jgi:tetratricopeptide (TPR) repeat protein
MKELLEQYAKEPNNDRVNYTLGLWYSEQGQYASALSFLLRAAELSKDENLSCDCLLINALNFRKMGERDNSQKNQLLHALALCPTRPEVYYLLSRYYAEKKQYHEGYAIAVQGQKVSESKPQNQLLEYPGSYGLIFNKAWCAWHIGLTKESRMLYKHLLNEVSIIPEFVNACRANLMNLWGEQFRLEGYSQCMQDKWVMAMVPTPSTYLEIGSNDPKYNSNTYLLEQNGWKGISVEIDKEQVDKFKSERSNLCIRHDATTLDYAELLKDMPADIGYLQVDCDPPKVSLKALEQVLKSGHRFAVITFEHDAFSSGTSVRDASRELLIEHGYVMIADNISVDLNTPYEDWWAHPALVPAKTIVSMQRVNGKTKRADLYLKSCFTSH